MFRYLRVNVLAADMAKLEITTLKRIALLNRCILSPLVVLYDLLTVKSKANVASTILVRKQGLGLAGDATGRGASIEAVARALGVSAYAAVNQCFSASAKLIISRSMCSSAKPPAMAIPGLGLLTWRRSAHLV